MEIILNQDIDNLGYKNQIITVKPGYGRNFLIPKGLAKIANTTNRKILAENLKQQAHKEVKLQQEATQIINEIKALTIKIAVKAGENGKIFGAVNASQLSEAIKKLGFEIDKKNIKIKESSIKNLGEYNADIRIYKELSASISFEVISE